MTQSVSLDLEPIRNIPAYRTVANLIEAKIMRGEWVVGHGLPSETALAEHLGVNRSTLREAIRVLEEIGLVRRRRGGKQLLVSAPCGTEVASRMTAAMVLQEMSFFELWEGMLCLEPALARAAAERITGSEIAALSDNVERTRRAVADRESLADLDLEFHDLIVRASRSRALQLCREPISKLFYPAFLQVFTRLNAGERLIFAHERILEGLAAHDPARARTWMDKHIVDFRRGYELANLDISKPVAWPANLQ